MSLPIVVIVGRPNVGKSSLLNALARERISIVDPRAGITRDRVSAVIEYGGRYFEVVDTGGIGMVDDDQLESHVSEQIWYAIHRAAVVLFVLDVQQGMTALDQQIAEDLRKVDAPVILVANKVDDVKHEPEAAILNRIGFGEPLCVSALHGYGRDALLEQIAARYKGDQSALPEAPVMKLAIIGKRNAGKSTLVNALAGEERMIVSEIPGTTRDAVDVQFEKDGKRFVAIDTAGVRKKSSMNDIDFYSFTRVLRSIRRADVVMYLIDATTPVAEVDLKCIRAVLDEQKPILLVVNKWDLAKDRADSTQFGEYLTKVMPWLSYAPIAFITANTGKNVDAAVDAALSLHRQAQTRVPTARLNEALETIVSERGPSAKRGTKRVRIYYGTQVAAGPPTIVFSCNDPAAVTENYRRYLENRLREMLPFGEVPVRLLFRSHHRKDA